MPRINLSSVSTPSRFELPAIIPQGTRDDTIFRYACSLRAMGVAEDDLRAAVEEANATRCNPPMTDREVEQKVRQALGYEEGHGASMGRPHARVERHVRKCRRAGRPDKLPDMSGLGRLEQARAWIDALFFPDDVVGLCFETRSRFPSTEWYAYAGQLCDPYDPMLEKLLGSANPSVGLYAVVNPITGFGGRRRDADIADLRWALVECDDLPPDEQLERMCALLFEPEDEGWKCKALAWSGNKSYHAVVYIGASTKEEYRSRVEDLYSYCDANGLPVDHSCGNPARLTRIPGVRRGDQTQWLRWCDGCPDYQA